MDNNKNRAKERGYSNAKARKIEPKDGEGIGIKDGEKIGHTANSKDHSGRREITY